MIYLIGGNDPKHNLSQLSFLTEFDIKKEDYVVLLGNIGYPNEETIKYLTTFPFTTLFLEGLSDNTNKLYKLEEIDWNGGKVHKIADNVLHLIRCNLYTIEGKTIFAIGGDVTYNRDMLRRDIDYYTKECPSKDELDEAVKVLTTAAYKVNYILSTIPDSRTMLQFDSNLHPNDLSNWMFDMSNKVIYDRWYFGQYPEVIDRDFDKCTGIGDGIIPLGYSIADIKNMTND